MEHRRWHHIHLVRTGTGTGCSTYQERGVVIIHIAIALTVLLGMAGLLLDGGIIFSERRRAQRASDAAALAAVQYCAQLNDEEFTGQWATPIQALARAYVRANAYSGKSDSDINVSVTADPGRWCLVEVTVRHEFPTFLIHILSRSPGSAIQARSVARFTADKISDIGLLALSQTTCPGLTITGNTTVSLTNASAYINAAPCTQGNTDSIEVNTSTSPGLYVTNGSILYYGERADCGSNQIYCSPQPQRMSNPYLDPLASLSSRIPTLPGPDPSQKLCTSGENYQLISGSATPNPISPTDQGFYIICYGSNSAINIQNNQEVRLNPGVYLLVRTDTRNQSDIAIRMNGGTLCVNNSQTNACFNNFNEFAQSQSPGVVIISTSLRRVSGNPATTNFCGGLSIGGTNSTVKLYGRTTGDWKGISIYQDPDCVFGQQAQESLFDFSSGGTLDMSGILYWPRGPVDIHGGGTFITGPIIADTITLGGNNALSLTIRQPNEATYLPYTLIR